MSVALRRIIGPLALVALFIVGDVAPAMAQRSSSDERLRDRLRRIERDINELQDQVDQQPSSTASQSEAFSPAPQNENLPATALLNERVDTLDRSVRDLTGQVEEMQFLINRLSQQMEQVTADFDYRLRALEGNLGPNDPGPSASGNTLGASMARAANTDTNGGSSVMDITPAPVTTGNVEVGNQGAPLPGASQPRSLGAISASRLSGSEEADFEIGMQLLRQGDFLGAESTFQQYISSYPESDQMGEAYFWLGESLYVRGLYSDAATSYLTSARDFGDSTKAPDSLLKLGMSLAALGQVDQACSAFAQVGRSYPDASSRVERNVTREQAANNCS